MTDHVEIEYGLHHWEPDTLNSATLDMLLLDVIADIWRDCYRQNDMNDRARKRIFRRKIEQALNAATGEEWELIR